MIQYQAPLQQIQSLLFNIFEVDQYWRTVVAGNREALPDRELAQSILEEAAKIAQNLLLPLNQSGDQQGCRFDNGQVTTPDGFSEAFRTYAASGWCGLGGNPQYGGQNLPKSLTLMVDEMLYASNPSFALYSVLSSGASLLIDCHASDSLKQQYLPALYEGRWTGTMCLTEAHAGSDLGAITTRAEPAQSEEKQKGKPDHYKITGNKIFITGGEHDLSDNIIHLVLARLPGAPAGSKGISLFLVPKFILDEAGHPGQRNGVRCIGIETKMGIKASSTCQMQFESAVGYLIGTPGRGLNHMFTMMNEERLSIAMQGLGIAETGYQSSLAYAQERVQGQVAPGAANNTIIEHPDIKRMLMTQKALNGAGRALAAYIGHQVDISRFSTNETEQADAGKMVALLTPVAKSFLTDNGFQCAVLAQQIFGGHGYISETGVEQLVRDARIAQIYEGTNGIQALDLLSRKILGDKLVGYQKLYQEMDDWVQSKKSVPELSNIAKATEQTLTELDQTTRWIADKNSSNPALAGAVASEYLELFGLTVYSYLWLRVADSGLESENKKTLETANFYVQHLLPHSQAFERSIVATDCV
ncbi:MAG: acyl-CoA dehydrogenase [Pseudomonadales bacterium]|nr:acyl-CoA dehydrogenase [Pseudomonadales bacterium]